MEVYAPPNQIRIDKSKISIFLAGTIDMGKSHDWQSDVIDDLSDREDIIIFNPRRVDWDNTWEQKITDPNFYQQVNWELNAMSQADIIIMNFQPKSKSPISLLELGMYAGSQKLLVCCPDEYERSGNVHIVCDNYGISLFKSLKELLDKINEEEELEDDI